MGSLIMTRASSGSSLFDDSRMDKTLLLNLELKRNERRRNLRYRNSATWDSENVKQNQNNQSQKEPIKKVEKTVDQYAKDLEQWLKKMKCTGVTGVRLESFSDINVGILAEDVDPSSPSLEPYPNLWKEKHTYKGYKDELGRPKGRAVVEMENGDTVSGLFHEGLRHGECRTETSRLNLSHMVGNYVKDQLEGIARMTFADGDMIEGFFHRGVLHGFVRKYDNKNRLTDFGFYENGNRHHENTLADSGMSSDSEDEEEEEVEHKSASGKVYNKDGFEIVPQQKIKRRANLSPEELALGEKLVRSKKARRDIMDDGWHRFMHDDTNLPDWFVKEEELHMKKKPDVDPETVAKYRERAKELNVKTIKKVVEAKARRKRKVARKLDQAKKKSAAILESEDTGSREKAKEIKALYRKAHMAGKPKEVSYVVARKHKAEKRSQRPSGIKGPYKQVDPRMKKDTSTKRSNVKKGKKRRLKGKQAKPTKQFNTNR